MDPGEGKSKRRELLPWGLHSQTVTRPGSSFSAAVGGDSRSRNLGAPSLHRHNGVRNAWTCWSLFLLSNPSPGPVGSPRGLRLAVHGSLRNITFSLFTTQDEANLQSD